MLGSLIYLTSSCQDITFFVGLYARCQANPKMSHLTQVKRIIKYISVTYDYGLLYSFGTYSFLVEYGDADWVGNTYGRKITYGECFFLGNNLIYGFSKK